MIRSLLIILSTISVCAAADEKPVSCYRVFSEHQKSYFIKKFRQIEPSQDYKNPTTGITCTLFPHGIPWEEYKSYLELKRISDINHQISTRDIDDVILTPLKMENLGGIPRIFQHPPSKILFSLKNHDQKTPNAIVNGDLLSLKGFEEFSLIDTNHASKWIEKLESDASQLGAKEVITSFQNSAEYVLPASLLTSRGYSLMLPATKSYCIFSKQIPTQPLQPKYFEWDKMYPESDPRISCFQESLEKFGIFISLKGEMLGGITGKMYTNASFAEISDLSLKETLEDPLMGQKLIKLAENFIKERQGDFLKTITVLIPDFQKHLFKSLGYNDTPFGHPYDLKKDINPQ